MDFDTNIWIVCDGSIMGTTEIDGEGAVGSGRVETGSIRGRVKGYISHASADSNLPFIN